MRWLPHAIFMAVLCFVNLMAFALLRAAGMSEFGAAALSTVAPLCFGTFLAYSMGGEDQ